MAPPGHTERIWNIDPNGGNSDSHARSDEEPQSFLENLDMSESEGFDFDFSCLQETSQSVEDCALDLNSLPFAGTASSGTQQVLHMSVTLFHPSHVPQFDTQALSPRLGEGGEEVLRHGNKHDNDSWQGQPAFAFAVGQLEDRAEADSHAMLVRQYASRASGKGLVPKRSF
ncbi:hypothetical protein IL306_014410 [Fusarium sp. DS 682]|nr:hypothetical protein IL306_014410 [Fusarium sp. DS 682]